MIYDEKDLYNRVTLALCRDCDIADAVLDCYNILKEVIPITGMTLGRTVPTETFIFTMVYKGEVNIRYNSYLHDSKTQEYFEDSSQSELNSKFGIEFLDHEHSIIKLCGSLSNETSQLMMYSLTPSFFYRVSHANKLTGGVFFYYEDDARISREDKHFLLSLRAPLSLIMNNAIQTLGLPQFDYTNLLEDPLYDAIYEENEIIGKGKGLRTIFDKIESVASLSVNIFLAGESGTGKERIANAIHDFSDRSKKPFIAVNCGAIPTSLIDSELFGHVKGAFTGAINSKKGYFERAHKGTLFLDEIGELPLEVQARLLRVLEDGLVTPVGGEKAIKIDFRLISATNNNLLQKMQEGLFREDLYYRLCELKLELPPLRERKNDIIDLINYFLKYYSDLFNLDRIKIPENEMNKLLTYSWPGNIRELQNVMKSSLAAMLDNRFIALIPDYEERLASIAKEKNVPVTPPTPIYVPAPPPVFEESLTFDEMQIAYFTKLLKDANGKIAGAHGVAERAKIDPNTLRSRLKKLGIKFKKGE